MVELTASSTTSAPRETGADHREIFSRIYHQRFWGEGSGHGSTLDYTREYRAFLEQFIVEHGIRSVLDAGCGDWSFSRAIDWKGARYVGLDVVPEVIERNRAGFPGVEFEEGDARHLDRHAGFDLLLVKDVLQHWSTRNVADFLAQPAIASFRHVLLTNCDLEHAENQDILDGDWRPLNLLAADFSLPGARTVRRFATKRIIHCGPRLTAADVFGRFEWWMVNLDRRADRLNHTLAQLERMGIRQVRRFQAFDGHRLQLTSRRPDWVRKGAVGCYLSHLALLKQAQARRQPCIILEDDLVLAPDFTEAFNAFFEAAPEDWDVILLSGGEHQLPPKELGPHHARLVATWGTSMSILRLPAIDRLLEEADTFDRPIDDFYIRMMSSLKFYAPARKLIAQEWNLGTDIGD